MTTLYACDLDGTLLDANAQFSHYTAAEFNRLTHNGRLISFVTARTPATVEPIAAPLHAIYPWVVMTGAAIWDPRRRQYISVHYHHPADARLIAQICADHHVNVFTYTLPRGTNRLSVYHPAPTLTPLEHTFVVERTINDLKHFNLNTPTPDTAYDHTILFFGMGAPDDINRVADRIRSATDCYASCYPDTYNPGVALLEVFAPGVSKAAGLLELKTLLGADHVVAFGDNLNDIPMLQAADTSIAVENAHPQVKAIATATIGPNTADSVIRYIATLPC